MDVIFTHCAGFDVHKKTVMACRMRPDPTGQQADGFMELQEFGTMTADLLTLSDWLAEGGVTHVADEHVPSRVLEAGIMPLPAMAAREAGAYWVSRLHSAPVESIVAWFGGGASPLTP